MESSAGPSSSTDLEARYTSVSEDNIIVVSHYINPNKFYFSFARDGTRERKSVIELEMNMEAYYNDQRLPDERYDPDENELVAFFHVTWRRHIRVLIDEIKECNNQTLYLAWAIDYGFPVHTRNLHNIKALPEKFQEHKNIFHEGILSVLPARTDFVFATNSTTLKRWEAWDERSVYLMSTLIADAAELKFIPKKMIPSKSICIGDVLLKNYDGSVYSLRNFLLDEKLALGYEDLNDFIKYYQKTTTVYVERWNDSFRHGGVIKTILTPEPAMPIVEDPSEPPVEVNDVQSKISQWKTEFSDSSSTHIDVEEPKIQASNVQQRSDSRSDYNPMANRGNSQAGSQKVIPNEKKDFVPPILDQKRTNPFGHYRYLKMLSDMKKSEAESQKSFNSIEFETSTKISDMKAAIRKRQQQKEAEKQKETEQSKPKETQHVNLIPANDSYDDQVLRPQNQSAKPKSKKYRKKKNDKLSESISSSSDSSYNVNISIINPFMRTFDKIQKSSTTEKVEEKTSATDKVQQKSSSGSENSHKVHSIFKRLQLQNANKNAKKENDNVELIPAGGSYDDQAIRPINHLKEYIHTKEKSVCFQFNNKREDKERSAAPVPVKTVAFKKALDDEACIVDSTKLRKVLVHGTCPRPVESIKDVPFSTSVHKYLENLKFSTPFKVQQYSWPLMMENSSFVIIGNRGGYKTYSYLPGICSILEGSEDPTKKMYGGELGPTAVIIVKSSQDVESIYHTIALKMARNSLVVVKAHGALNIEKVQTELLCGCHILVTTPPCFSRLANCSGFELFDKKRIKNLIIDDYDMIIKRFKTEIDEVLQKCCSSSQPEENPQIVITSNVWFSSIQKIMSTYSMNTTYVFGNYVEAAVYANTNFSLKMFTDEDKKMQEVLDFLKTGRYLHEKTIVFTNSDEETREICVQLRDKSISYLKLDLTSRKGIEQDLSEWNRNKSAGSFSVIVGSDQYLRTVDLGLAQHLIHYSLPETFDMFSARFACSLVFYSKKLSKTNSGEQTAMIMLDEKNNLELPRLIEFWKLHQNIVLPPTIDDMVKKALTEKEKDMRGVVCSNIYDYGYCPDRIYCRDYRHAFRKEDYCGYLPASRVIKFDIIRVHSLKHFSVRINKVWKVKESKWQSFNSISAGELELKLNVHYLEEVNCFAVRDLSAGVVCAYKSKGGFHRCIILKTTKIPNTKNYLLATIKLIDTGENTTTPSTQLFELPDEFKAINPIAIDLFINDLVPFDFDNFWEKESVRQLDELLKSYAKTPNMFFSCNIDFVVADSIFTNTIKVNKTLEFVHTPVEKENIRAYLLSNKLCLADETTTQQLKELARICGALRYGDVSSCNLETVDDASGILGDNSTITTSQKSDHSTVTKKEENTKFQDAAANNSKSSFPSLKLPNPKLISGSVKSLQSKFQQLLASQKSQPKKMEKWMELTLLDCYQVHITQFASPDEIFVQIIDKNDKWSELVTEIEAADIVEPLRNPEPGLACLVRSETYTFSRAKILEVNEEEGNVECCDVDTGVIEKHPTDEVYEIPDGFIEKMPYQLIRCKMAGIKSKSGNGWTDDDAMKIQEFLEDEDAMFIRVCAKLDLPPYSKHIPYNSYEIVLATESDLENNTNVNLRLIQEKLVTKDQNSSADLSTPFEFSWDDVYVEENFVANVPESDNEILNDSDFDVQMDFNDPAMQAILSYLGVPRNLVADQINNRIEAIAPPIQRIEEGENEIEEIQVEDGPVKPVQLLQYMFNYPEIEWQQNESTIKLKVSATDCLDYTLDVSSEYLMLIVKFKDNYKCALIHFFGAIDAEITSHEIRGLNIIIRLLKKVQSNMLWPRLLFKKSRENWLKFNTQSLNVQDDFEMKPLRMGNANPELDGNNAESEDESDSDDGNHLFIDKKDPNDPHADDFFD